MKGLPIVLLVVLLAAMTSAPAQADKPMESSADFDEDILVVDCAAYGHNFEVWDHSQVHERWTDFYDKDGNWLRQEDHVHGVDHLYNSGGPENSVEGSFHLAAHITPGPEPNYYHVTRTGVDWEHSAAGLRGRVPSVRAE